MSLIFLDHTYINMNLNSLWEELIFEFGSIIKNKTNEKESNLIGTGNRSAKILFIGDDSDLYADENLTVNPASSGEFLIKLCDITGILPDDYYITTLTKNKMKFKEFFEQEQAHFIELLNMQIALINPIVIVALGERVANILLDREINFPNEKSQILDFAGDMKLLITYDPYYAKQSRENYGKKSTIAMEFWNDLKLVNNYIRKN